MTSKSNYCTIKGFIQATPRPSGHEEDSAKVAIVTADGTEYPVLHKGAGVDLVEYISADVEVVAMVEPAPHAEAGQALRVRSYTITDGYEDPWYDDEDDG